MQVKADVPSDPYLIDFYDKQTLFLSHNSLHDVIFVIEANPTGNGDWREYRIQQVKADEKSMSFLMGFRYTGFVSVDADTKDTPWLVYE